MKMFIKKLRLEFLFIIYFFLPSHLIADNHNIYETIEQLQKDIKTLERAVYSGSTNLNNEINNTDTSLDPNSEDVLTRHLLKLTEIETQFQNLTNRFEEINFKLDKLSNRLSKVQADNQIRFQDLENATIINDDKKTLAQNSKDKILPGSSQPQDLGSISYKDTNTNETIQQTQSIDTTATIITETFQAEEKILPSESPENQYEFATSF